MDAVLRVDHVAGLPTLLEPLVHARRAIPCRRPCVPVMLGGPLQDGIRDLKMHRLILLVIGVGHEHRGETVEGELAIRLGIDDGRKRGRRL